MKVAVIKHTGEDTGRKADLSDSIYKVEPNDHAIYLDVKHYLASQRQGTHKSKERADIIGSTRKVKRQKGTGTARAGSIKNPLFRGGGRVFGPRPRSYRFKLNKGVKALARRSALSYKAKEKSLSILEDFTFEQPRTKQFTEILSKLSLTDKKTLLVLAQKDNNITLSCRNLKKAKVITADLLNTYDLLNAETLLISEGSLEKIESLLN